MSQTGPGGGATSRRRLWESGGEVPSRWAIFCKFLGKMAIVMPFGLHFARFQSHLKEQNFWDLKPIEQIPPFTLSKVQYTFKILHFGVKFCGLAWSGESRYIAFCRTVTIRCGRLGAGGLCAADYAQRLLGARGHLKNFFSKKVFFQKFFSTKTNFFPKKNFFFSTTKRFSSQNNFFQIKNFLKKNLFHQKSFTLLKCYYFRSFSSDVCQEESSE